MNLQPSPFEKIKNGSKTIEVRLLDEKRQLINVGDEIEFSSVDPSQVIRTKVIELLKYKTFSDLFDAFPPELFGGKNKNDLMGIYKYYSKEDEGKYGVLGIRLQFLG